MFVGSAAFCGVKMEACGDQAAAARNQFCCKSGIAKSQCWSEITCLFLATTFQDEAKSSTGTIHADIMRVHLTHAYYSLVKRTTM